jgi:DNA-binding CsgD family transcriptional regulator
MPDAQHGDRPPLVLPLDPPSAFLGWLATRYHLTPREVTVLRCRVGQLTFKETARILGVAVNYTRRIQATILTKIEQPGGHTSLMRWTAEQYRAWSGRSPRGEPRSGGLDDGGVMAIRHRPRPIDGVQFHSESVAIEQGFALISN